VARPNDLGKLALKRIQLRADGRNPVRLERFEHELNLGTADVRRGKVKARHSVLKVQMCKSERGSGAKVET
jgi:hypothetical protein